MGQMAAASQMPQAHNFVCRGSHQPHHHRLQKQPWFMEVGIPNRTAQMEQRQLVS